MLAPGVLDMSPGRSVSGSPSHSGHNLSDTVEHDEWLSYYRNIVVGTFQPVTSAQDLSDCVSKVLNSNGGSECSSCDECGQLSNTREVCNTIATFIEAPINVHHVERLFLRRWDMEGYLHKSKYGCPANRFSSSE